MLIPRSKRNNVWGKDVYLQLESSYQTSFQIMNKTELIALRALLSVSSCSVCKMKTDYDIE